MKYSKRPIGVYYEHPRWFEPVFAEMDRRGVPYVRLDAARHHFDISPNGAQQFGLIFNRMSPSAWTRGNAHAIFYTLSYLAHLERMGMRVVNGSEGFRNETSKALQLSLLESLGLPYPRSVVINHPPPGRRRSARNAFPRRRQAQYRRQRRGHRALRFAGADRSAAREDKLRVRPRRHRHRAGIHSRARRIHHPRRNARLQISLRHQSVHCGRNVRPLPHGHLQDHRRREDRNRMRGRRRRRPA